MPVELAAFILWVWEIPSWSGYGQSNLRRNVGNTYQSTQCHVPQDLSLRQNRHLSCCCSYNASRTCQATLWSYVWTELVVFCNENQLDALFILNLFRPTISICFVRIYCPSSGGIHCICTAVGTCYTFRWMAAGRVRMELYMYSEYLLMMGNKYVRNM
jgi:hypothetical protein